MVLLQVTEQVSEQVSGQVSEQVSEASGPLPRLPNMEMVEEDPDANAPQAWRPQQQWIPPLAQQQQQALPKQQPRPPPTPHQQQPPQQPSARWVSPGAAAAFEAQQRRQAGPATEDTTTAAAAVSAPPATVGAHAAEPAAPSAERWQERLPCAPYAPPPICTTSHMHHLPYAPHKDAPVSYAPPRRWQDAALGALAKEDAQDGNKASTQDGNKAGAQSAANVTEAMVGAALQKEQDALDEVCTTAPSVACLDVGAIS